MLLNLLSSFSVLKKFKKFSFDRIKKIFNDINIESSQDLGEILQESCSFDYNKQEKKLVEQKKSSVYEIKKFKELLEEIQKVIKKEKRQVTNESSKN